MSDRDTGAPPVALVTGAAGMVGSAIARRLAADGFVVAEAELTRVEVANETSIVGAVSHAAAGLGQIELLVINVGESTRVDFPGLDAAGWDRLLDSHLRAVTGTCRAVLPAMVEARRGTIVTIVPQIALFGGGPAEAYDAAAAGTIIGYTKSLAVEMAPHGIRMNCIAAPASDTGAAVADTVSFLARDGDFYVGQVFTPDGSEAEADAR